MSSEVIEAKESTQSGATPFLQRLDAESLAVFAEMGEKPFSEQAVFVLNAFFDEIGDQAECIYKVAWEIIKQADMMTRNVQYLHLYKEGNDLDFDMTLYFFEQLVKFFDRNPEWKERGFERSIPKEMTAIQRKQEIRQTVDVNFDNRISFMEYLLYQYNLSPKEFITRHTTSTTTEVVNEDLVKARQALSEVNAKIQEYEALKADLERRSEGTGVKALTAKNELAQLHASPLAETLRRLLIIAESAVRIAIRTGGGSTTTTTTTTTTQPRNAGEMWWLDREVKSKTEKYNA